VNTADFVNAPVVGGHIHFPRPALMDDVLAVLEATQVGLKHLQPD
jgi:hypothetical protein